jgi:hypothetical protein
MSVMHTNENHAPAQSCIACSHALSLTGHMYVQVEEYLLLNPKYSSTSKLTPLPQLLPLSGLLLQPAHGQVS